MANCIQESANKFRSDYRLTQISSQRIEDIIKSQGYKVVRYNKSYNNENIEILINNLELNEYAQAYCAFTYSDDKYRIVFIEDGLSEEETLILLLHEEGHIYNEHFGETIIAGKNIKDEYEADEFAHYILNPTKRQKIKQAITHHKVLTTVIIISIVMAISASIITPIIINESKYNEEYYVSPSGHKFHKKECFYIRDKSTKRRITKEEIENGDYEPCKVCLPDWEE